MKIGSLGLIALFTFLATISISIASAAKLEEDSYLDFSDGTGVNVNVIDEGGGDGSIVLSQGSSGTYTSNWYNAGAPRKYNQINWQAEIPVGTSIKFQIRTRENGYVLGPIGPDGTMDSYYTASGSSISNLHEGYSEIQYIAYLSTTDTSKTPKIKMVQIDYSDEAVSPIIVPFGSSSPPPIAPVPEPLSIVLVGVGLIALLGLYIFKK
jgi:hypothetical protein